MGYYRVMLQRERRGYEFYSISETGSKADAGETCRERPGGNQPGHKK